MTRTTPIAALALLALAACQEQPAATKAPATPAAAAAMPQVQALRETDPVNTEGDAADDPAIWVNPADPAQSLIIGTAKKSGLYTYGLDGKMVQFLPEGRLNNVDIRSVRLEGGDKTVVVAASDRDTKSIALFKLDPATRQLSVLADRQPSGFADPYGFCLYHSLATDTLYAFMTDKAKGGAQWRIESAGGKVTAVKVRDLPLATQSEGCVADDLGATVYVAEETVGVWSFPAEPDQPATATPVAMVAANPKLVPDMEGLAIYRNETGASYLLLSSQGNNSYAVFDLGGSHAYKGSFAVGKGAVDGTSETDGIEVTSDALGAEFPHGLFVAQDGENTDPAANQNFKLVPWDPIAKALDLK